MISGLFVVIAVLYLALTIYIQIGYLMICIEKVEAEYESCRWQTGPEIGQVDLVDLS